jgi:hypothetical protein
MTGPPKNVSGLARSQPSLAPHVARREHHRPGKLHQHQGADRRLCGDLRRHPLAPMAQPERQACDHAGRESHEPGDRPVPGFGQIAGQDEDAPRGQDEHHRRETKRGDPTGHSATNSNFD